ncbi:MAG: class D sortase [Clostridiales bacterium]|nr:class D sortase [Clostridiales bacterium]
MNYKGEKVKKELIESFEKDLKAMEQWGEPADDEGSGDSSDNVDNPSRPATNSKAIAMLEIPKIDLLVPVVEGTDPEDIKYAVGHFKNTDMPGTTGNFAVAGHRSYTYNEYFNRLDELEKGDTIKVKTKDGKQYTYEVFEKLVVLPEETSVLMSTKEPIITLVTCTPIRKATHRLIVKGKLIQ